MGCRGASRRVRRPGRGSLNGGGGRASGLSSVHAGQAVYIRLTGAASDDAFPPLLLREAGHKVVRAANFEAENLLEILALEIYLVPKLCAEIRGMNKRCLFKDLVDLGGQDKTEVVRGICGWNK